jgi:hypothetical protein
MSIESSISYTLEKEDGSEVELDITFTMSDYDPGVRSGPVERCYPPEGGEVEVTECDPDCPEFWARYNDSTGFQTEIDDLCAEKGMELLNEVGRHGWDENL